MFRRPTPPTSATPKEAADARGDAAALPQVQPFSAAELGEPPALAMPPRAEARPEPAPILAPPPAALLRPEPARAELPRAPEPARAEPVRSEPMRSEQLRPEPARMETRAPAIERSPEPPAAKPIAAPAAAAPAAPSSLASSNMAPKMEMPPRRVVDIPGAPTRRPDGGLGNTFTNNAGKDLRTLVVSREISLNGEIASCDALVVEGTVEAKLRDGSMIQIADTGLFKGSVEIEEADIGGRFEGDLTVRGRLTVRATGRINGTIRYGELMIEAGGKLMGEIHYVGAEDGSDALYNALRNSAE